MMHITFVKKIKADGAACRKCVEVEERLEKAGLMGRMDRIVVADERDPSSEGMRLAAELGVDAAPFFVVSDGGTQTVFTSYVKLLKTVLAAPVSDGEEAKELLEQSGGDLDFL
jgi:hypothetical protein